MKKCILDLKHGSPSKNHQRCVAWPREAPQHPSFAAKNPMNCDESKMPTRRHFELSPIARNLIINLAEVGHPPTNHAMSESLEMDHW